MRSNTRGSHRWNEPCEREGLVSLFLLFADSGYFNSTSYQTSLSKPCSIRCSSVGRKSSGSDFWSVLEAGESRSIHTLEFVLADINEGRGLHHV